MDGWAWSAQPNPTQSILIIPAESWVTLDVAGRRMEFLMNTGTACSVLTWLAGHVSNYGCIVLGVNGQTNLRWLIFPFTSIIAHSFLYMSEWLSSASKGRDLLNKMGPIIFLEQGEIQQMTNQSRNTPISDLRQLACWSLRCFPRTLTGRFGGLR